MGGTLMLQKLLAISVILLATISISFAGSVPNMQEGNWEITTRMEMQGMTTSMPPVTYTQCMTKKDFVPQGSQQGGECQITQSKVVGDTVTWVMKCHGHGGDAIANGKITYKGNRFEGTVEMSMDYSEMKMVNHITGKRLGDCK
jgi:hypothetical protein